MADGPGDEADDDPAREAPPSSRAADRSAGSARSEPLEERYDFDDFGPADMAEMSLEEWEAAFDADTWITGPELIDRVEAELTARIADGELFAVVERHQVDGEPQLLAYTDAEYAIVHPDGRVAGDGALPRDVEPVVALSAMDTFEVADPPDGAGLPHPDQIKAGSGSLGHRLLLALAVVQVLAGLVVLLAPLLVDVGPGAAVLTTVVGLGFVAVGVVLGVLVANARLSDRFRAAAYRERLRAAGVGSDERPSFLPSMGPSETNGSDSDGDGSSPPSPGR